MVLDAAVCSAVLFIVSSWLACDWCYGRIHGHRLAWWAKPFAVGALLFDKRLKDWEA
jgi:hypothetical protein